MTRPSYPGLNGLRDDVVSNLVSKGSKKIPKEAVLYVFRPETNYTCGKCVFIKSPTCTIFADKVNPKTGSCGFYIHGDVGDRGEIPMIGFITKEQSGYAENSQGFSCKRCEYFVVGKNDCRLVDRNSEGDTAGMIHPNACCNRWEPDTERASKTDEQLEGKV